MQTEENAERAGAMATMLMTFSGDEDFSDLVSSALTDLRHLCDREDLDFTHLNACALTNYRAETHNYRAETSKIQTIVDYQTGQISEVG